MIAPRPFPGYVAALLAAGAVTFVSAAARAECTADAECGQGFTCQVVGGGTCPGYACPDNGEPCPEQPPCEPQVIKDCRPGPCNADADCADGMVCFAYTTSVCSTPAPNPACPPGEKCEAPPPDMGTCTSQTEKQCVPRYLLPCTAAAECGAGFNCVLDTPSCWCNGSSGGGTPGMEPSPPTPTPNPAPSGGGTDPAPMPAPSGTGTEPMPPPDRMPGDCGCTPATTNHCEPQAVSCSANTDCPSGWVCQNVAPPSTGACAARLLPDGGVETTCDPTPPPAVQMQCVPPYYNNFGHGFANDGSASFPPTSAPVPAQGGGTTGGTTTGLPGSEMGAGNGQTTGTPKSGSSGAAPSASSGDTGGCQVGHGGTSAGASLLALFGLLGLSRRKRSRVR